MIRIAPRFRNVGRCRFNSRTGWRRLTAMSPIVAIGALLFAGSLFGQEKKPGVPEVEAALDHFLCYFAADNEFKGPTDVSLKDQWAEKPKPATVMSRQLLCNPAGKEGAVPKRSNSHLVCYDIGVEDFKKDVLVENQLDRKKKQPLSLISERYLCLPSGKRISDEKEDISKLEPPPIPTDLDHFKCYQVKRVTKAEGKYQVTDQFRDYDVELIEAVLLCNPVEKFRKDESRGERLHPSAHLVCYLLKSNTQTQWVRVANQFEKHVKFQVNGPNLLCLPSTKETVEKR
jgi:hypothetical protein